MGIFGTVIHGRAMCEVQPKTGKGLGADVRLI